MNTMRAQNTNEQQQCDCWMTGCANGVHLLPFSRNSLIVFFVFLHITSKARLLHTVDIETFAYSDLKTQMAKPHNDLARAKKLARMMSENRNTCVPLWESLLAHACVRVSPCLCVSPSVCVITLFAPSVRQQALIKGTQPDLQR